MLLSRIELGRRVVYMDQKLPSIQIPHATMQPFLPRPLMPQSPCPYRLAAHMPSPSTPLCAAPLPGSPTLPFLPPPALLEARLLTMSRPPIQGTFLEALL